MQVVVCSKYAPQTRRRVMRKPLGAPTLQGRVTLTCFLHRLSYRRVALWVLLALLLWISVVAVEIYQYSFVRDSLPADAAIVLGTEIWGDQPSPVFRERINHAIETVTVVIGYYVVQWNARLLVGFAVIAITSLVVTILLYDLVVKRTSMTHFLFGMRPKKDMAKETRPAVA